MTYTPGSTVILLRDWRDLSRGAVGEIRYVDDALAFVPAGDVYINWLDRRGLGPVGMPLSTAREVLEVVNDCR